MEHQRRRLAVDVGLAREGVLEMGVARDVGQDAQLDLAVVGRHEGERRLAGHERAADAPAELGPDGDVLEVGIRRGQPAGGGHGLVEGRVQPAVVGHQRRERLDIGRPELRVGPPLEDGLDDRVDRAQLLQDGGVRRVTGLGLAPERELELAEEHLTELLGRPDRELVPDGGIHLAFEALDLGGELPFEIGQRLEVEGDAGGLHAGQDGDQRTLELGEEPIEPGIDHRPFEQRSDGRSGQRVETRPCRRVEILRRRHLDIEALGRHIGDGLAAQRGVEHVGGDLRVEGDGQGRGPRVTREPVGQHGLHVMADERLAALDDEVAQAVDGVRRGSDDHAPVLTGDREGLRLPMQGPRVRGDEGDGEVRLCRQPRSDVVEPVRRPDLEPTGILDRRRKRGRQVTLGDLGQRPVVIESGEPTDAVEVEAELEPVAVRRAACRGRPGARGARRAHAAAELAQAGRGLLRCLTAKWRQTVDQGAELVLAEDADHGLPVVVADLRPFRVERHRQVAHETHAARGSRGRPPWPR